MLNKLILGILLVGCGAQMGAQAAEQPAAAPDAALVRKKLERVLYSVDAPKVALAMYYQEMGSLMKGAPAVAQIGQGGFAPNAPTVPGTAWNSLGFSTYPALPAEVSSLALAPATGELTITLANIQPGIDGTTVTMHPAISNNAMTWTNTCTSKSPLVKEVFSC